MFGRDNDKLLAEKLGLEMRLRDEKDRHLRTQKLLDFARDWMDVEKARRERDEARSELEKVKGELRDAKNAADDARREARRLERRLELVNAEFVRYVVQTEGREVEVTAVTHDEILGEELLLLDRDEAVVAKFNTYSSYRIEPLPAE